MSSYPPLATLDSLRVGDRVRRLSGGPVWTPAECYFRGEIECLPPNILRVGPLNGGVPDAPNGEETSGEPGGEDLAPANGDGGPGDHPLARCLDTRSVLTAAGLLDVHMHGAGGGDALWGETAQVDLVRQTAARGGAAGIVIVVPYFADDKDFSRYRACITALQQSRVPGARILGIHLETPFLNPVRRGGFPETCCLPVDIGLFNRLCDLAEGMVRVVTLSPELPGAEDLIKAALARGVRVSLGHSAASAEIARKAIALGADRLTHTFNAMNGLHHRESGLLAAALLEENVFLEAIPDGVHVGADALKILVRLAGPQRIVGITDGNAGAGMPEGTPVRAVGGNAKVQNHAVRLADGTLAGSTILADGAMRGLIHLGGMSPRGALECVTLTAARSLGLDGRTGSLRPGLAADITLLNPCSYKPIAVISEGVTVWTSPQAQ